MVWKKPSIHELIILGCDIYPITSSPKKLDVRTQEGSFMGYIKSRDTMKWWDPYTNKIKYYSYIFFDEHSNKFGKGWSPGSKLLLGTNISTLPTLKIDLSDHPFTKNDIFEGNVNFTPMGTPIDTITQ